MVPSPLLCDLVAPEAVRVRGLLLEVDLLGAELFSGFVEGKLNHDLKTFCHQNLALPLILSHDPLSSGLLKCLLSYEPDYLIFTFV